MYRHDFHPGGFLVVDKPAGMTSFDVIRALRRILGTKKMGHSGVLDRPAMGVLVVGLGQATRLFELFHSFEKEYEADVWLGLSTSTDDLTGELLGAAKRNPLELDPDEIRTALGGQVGELDQLPPAFSLTKVDGRELYRYALAKEEVNVKPKRVYIGSIRVIEDDLCPNLAEALPGDSKLRLELLEKQPLRRVRIRVTCRGGVYVRSIARDVGIALGCSGSLGRLVRLRVGPFSLDSAMSLEQVEEQRAKLDSVTQLLLPLSSIAPDHSSVRLDSSQLALVASGRSIRRFSQSMPAQLQRGEMVFGVSGTQDGPQRLVALLTVGDTNHHGLVELRPSKVLLQSPLR